MRQKVALAGALVHAPRVIILDEPLTGLDAGSARQVKRVLRERVAAGDTVIMTTHILEVAERMADRVGIIAGGRLIAEGTLDELRMRAGKGHTSLEDTFLTLVAEQQAAHDAGRLAHLVREPRAAPRLARLAVDDDGRAARPREASWRSRSSIFVVFAHVLAWYFVARYVEDSADADRSPRWWSSPAACCSPGRC